MKTGNALMKHHVLNDKMIAGTGIGPKPVINNREVEFQLSGFKPHSLDNLHDTDLMTRVDTKYLLPVHSLRKLLTILAPDYSVLEVNFRRLFHYETTYFDTPGFEFYLMHHNGKQNREKFRHRLYVESGDRYAEVKNKTNKGITRKNRIRLNGHSYEENSFDKVFACLTEKTRDTLCKSLVCSYVRIALADEKNEERLTLDYNLSFTDPGQTRQKATGPALIAEVKRKHRKSSSRFLDLMNQFRCKPVTFSKYCIGCALLYSDTIKTNRFKHSLMTLARISEKTPVAQDNETTSIVMEREKNVYHH